MEIDYDALAKALLAQQETVQKQGSVGYAIQPDLLSFGECCRLADLIDERAETQGTVKETSDGEASSVDENIRRGKVAWLAPYDKSLPLIKQSDLQNVLFSMVGLAHICNGSTFAGHGITLDSYPAEQIQLTKYETGDFYNTHNDEEWHQGHGRKLSITVTISHPKIGGEFVLEDADMPSEHKELLREPGTAIVFPSWAKHHVSEVCYDDDVRRSLVLWCSGTG